MGWRFMVCDRADLKLAPVCQVVYRASETTYSGFLNGLLVPGLSCPAGCFSPFFSPSFHPFYPTPLAQFLTLSLTVACFMRGNVYASLWFHCDSSPCHLCLVGTGVRACYHDKQRFLPGMRFSSPKHTVCVHHVSNYHHFFCIEFTPCLGTIAACLMTTV